jgi:hypothetical protein
MSCCNGTQSKEAFLIQKGKNFREYINKYKPTKEVLDYMDRFNETNLMTSITSLLIPLKLSGTSSAIIGELIKRLEIPANEEEEVKSKIGRYFDMFAEVSLSSH